MKTKKKQNRILHSACTLCLLSPQARGWASSIRNRRVNIRTRRHSSSPLYVPDSSEATDRLLHILEEQECEGLEALELGVDNQTGLRGLYSKEEFQQGEYICAVPFPSALLLEDNLETAMNQIYDTIEIPSIRQGLRFFQEVVNDPSQDWKPYIDTIPTTTDSQFDATPDFYEESTIRELQIPKMVEDSLVRKREVVRVAQEADVSTDQLQWCAWIAQTRGFSTFKVLRNDKGDEAAVQQRAWLLPYLDMLNHDGTLPNASIEVVETPGSFEDSFFALQALAPVSVGEEVKISYGTGRETCLDMFSTYGFWLEDSAADEILVDWKAVDPQWTTSLAQDEASLKDTTNSNLQKVLALRIHLKRLQKRINTDL